MAGSGESLGSAPVPPPQDDDHVRGPVGAPLVIQYADFECPFCAATHGRLAGLELRLIFRHFPVRSSHPRAWPAACAVEAAAAQGAFWPLHDRLMADPARLEDPDLWRYASELELDLERFDSERRGPEVLARVQRDFRDGVRAGVVSTPALFVLGPEGPERADVERLEQLSR